MLLRDRVRAATLIVVFLAPWPILNTISVLLPRISSIGVAHMSDLYPRWVGTRAAWRGESPYSEAVTARIQAGYYGRVVTASQALDEQRFAYPAHVVVLLAPLSVLPFDTARLLALALLLACSALAVWIWLDASVLHKNRALVLAAMLTSMPICFGLAVQQLTLLASFLLAAAFWCVMRERLWFAGAFLAAATFKPQLCFLAIPCLIAWAWLHARAAWKLTASFCGGCAALLFLSFRIAPHWVASWLASLRAYGSYTKAALPLQFLFGKRLGLVLSLVLIAYLGLITVTFLQRHQLFPAMAVALALTAAVIPTIPFAVYNQVLLLPAFLMLMENAHNNARLLRSTVLVACALGNVGALVSVVCAALHFRASEATLLPYSTFALLPVLLAAWLATLPVIGRWHKAPFSSESRRRTLAASVSDPD